MYIERNWIGRWCDFKTGGRNISDLCCTDNTILIAENANDLPAVVMKAKEHIIMVKHKGNQTNKSKYSNNLGINNENIKMMNFLVIKIDWRKQQSKNTIHDRPGVSNLWHHGSITWHMATFCPLRQTRRGNGCEFDSPVINYLV